MDDNAQLSLGRAELADQGKLGPFLKQIYGPAMAVEHDAALAAAFPVSSVEDELMAADDFYFSTIDLMDCCYLARDGSRIVGAVCLNPYVAELQYLAVHPDWRRKGVATALVGLVLAEANRRGLDHLRADVSLALAEAGGLSFLAKAGFTEIRRSVLLGKKLDIR